jgi:hypothetical protein
MKDPAKLQEHYEVAVKWLRQSLLEIESRKKALMTRA